MVSKTYSKILPIVKAFQLKVRSTATMIDTEKPEKEQDIKKTVEFLDAIKLQEGIKSDYALANFLSESYKRISNYRTGTSQFNGEMCIKVARVLKLPEGLVAASIEAERAKSPPVRKMWQHVAQTLSGKEASFKK